MRRFGKTTEKHGLTNILAQAPSSTLHLLELMNGWWYDSAAPLRKFQVVNQWKGVADSGANCYRIYTDSRDSPSQQSFCHSRYHSAVNKAMSIVLFWKHGLQRHAPFLSFDEL